MLSHQDFCTVDAHFHASVILNRTGETARSKALIKFPNLMGKSWRRAQRIHSKIESAIPPKSVFYANFRQTEGLLQ